MDDHTRVNRAFWDEVAPHHAASEFYAVERFVADPDSLGAIETAELGDVSGLSICHLQCHLGLDTLSLARRGATVTGVDFSAESLRLAAGLAERTGIPATFVHSDVVAAAATLGDTYDLVFTTRGVLMWIADLDLWARSCSDLVRPGGAFYLLDIHPLAMVLHPAASGFTLESSYFGGAEPIISTADASYAVSGVGLSHQETREWVHPVGRVITALAGAGLRIDFLHEHPADERSPTSLSPSASGAAGLPGLYSVGAHRPA